jgi:hypothetical protein
MELDPYRFPVDSIRASGYFLVTTLVSRYDSDSLVPEDGSDTFFRNVFSFRKAASSISKTVQLISMILGV